MLTLGIVVAECRVKTHSAEYFTDNDNVEGALQEKSIGLYLHNNLLRKTLVKHVLKSDSKSEKTSV